MTRTVKNLGSGLELIEFVDIARPLRAFMVKADLADNGLRLRVINGEDRLCSICPVSAMARLLKHKTEGRLVAGINGDFFEFPSNPLKSHPYAGRTCRMSISDGMLMQTGYEFPPGNYDSLYGDANGKIAIGRIGFKGSVTFGEREFAIHHVNTIPTYLPSDPARQPAAVAVFTELWPQGVPADGVLVQLDRPLKGERGAAAKSTGHVIRRIVKGERLPVGKQPLAAVIGLGAAANGIVAATGDGVIEWSFPGATGDIRDLIGIWNRPLTDSTVNATHEQQNYPRTAFGFDPGRGKLCLFVADGRQNRWSKSLTSCEMAELLKKEGFSQVGQFDGGGSTTMWVDGHVVNRPSNPMNGERSVGSGVFLSIRPDSAPPHKADID